MTTIAAVDALILDTDTVTTAEGLNAVRVQLSRRDDALNRGWSGADLPLSHVQDALRGLLAHFLGGDHADRVMGLLLDGESVGYCLAHLRNELLHETVEEAANALAMGLRDAARLRELAASVPNRDGIGARTYHRAAELVELHGLDGSSYRPSVDDACPAAP